MNEEKNWAKIALGLVLFVPSLLFSIFVIATIWNWYMPLFGLASIKMVQAFGLSLLVSLLTAKVPSKTEVESKYSSLEKKFILFASNALFLGIGWIGQLFI